MQQWFGLVARLVTGVVWLIAGALKLPDLDASVRAVRAYQLLPEAIVPTVGYVLPVLEVAVGVCLILGLLVRVNGVVSSILYVAFIIGIAAAWARGLEIDCGCFGGGGVQEGASENYPMDIARDVALLALSLWLVVRPQTTWAVDNLIFRREESDLPADLERNDDGEQQARLPR